MSAQVIDLDDHRRVWRVVQGKCRLCGHTGVSTQHIEVPLDSAECPACGEDTWAVTQYLVGGMGGGEPVWEPRIEEVQSPAYGEASGLQNQDAWVGTESGCNIDELFNRWLDKQTSDDTDLNDPREAN